jgi:hypothetical protein
MAAGSAAGSRNRRMTAHSRKYSYDAGQQPALRVIAQH